MYCCHSYLWEQNVIIPKCPEGLESAPDSRRVRCIDETNTRVPWAHQHITHLVTYVRGQRAPSHYTGWRFPVSPDPATLLSLPGKFHGPPAGGQPSFQPQTFPPSLCSLGTPGHCLALAHHCLWVRLLTQQNHFFHHSLLHTKTSFTFYHLAV